LHEFIRTCRLIGCKPYLAANVRTQPARDFYQEVEYCNAPAGNLPSNSAAPPQPDALAALRAANGDREPSMSTCGVSETRVGDAAAT
jgi:alpha-L-arabinofuranosidase